MNLHHDSRRKSPATLERVHPGARFIDITSRGDDPWVRLSPFYPHGGIPVPFSPGLTGASVEGIWQGLKVFEQADVDAATLAITSMRGIKRTTRRYGRVLGHRRGLYGDVLLSYHEARHLIYLPVYRHVLEHLVPDLITNLRAAGSRQPIVLLDYETNGDVEDLTRPLSHAALVVSFLLDQWPGPAATPMAGRSPSEAN